MLNDSLGIAHYQMARKREKTKSPPLHFFDLTNTLKWFLSSALIYEEELSSVYTLPYRMLEKQAD